MNDVEALASIKGISSLRLEGQTLEAEIASVLTDATIERTMDGASTLTLSIHDSKRTFVRSTILTERITAQVGAFAFELAQVRKSGNTVTLTFEDLPVAALRRRDEPRKVEPGQMTHVDFARMLVAEEPWIPFVTAGTAEVAKTELMRGRLAEAGTTGTPTAEQREDTWSALGRISEERGWRRYIHDNALHYISDAQLFLADPEYVFSEDARAGVDWIDFDFDTGKPVAKATIMARGGQWIAPVGSTIEIANMGPATGKWLVESVSRSLFDLAMPITAIAPRPMLPEPEPTVAETGADGSAFLDDEAFPFGAEGEGMVPVGAGTTTTTTREWAWPITGGNGKVSSGFGMRNGKMHNGIDVVVPIGTPVYASQSGTVTNARSIRGYGNAIYLAHGNEMFTRYAHLDRILVKRGQVVNQGDRIGISGNTGQSTGPHLHFEIRRRIQALNPIRFLEFSQGGSSGIRYR